VVLMHSTDLQVLNNLRGRQIADGERRSRSNMQRWLETLVARPQEDPRHAGAGTRYDFVGLGDILNPVMRLCNAAATRDVGCRATR